jgi:hypothetical protein
MTEVTRPPRKSTLGVTLYDGLEDVLKRLRDHAGQPVRLDIPPGSPLFLTAHEFSALLEVSHTRGIDLTIVSDDPLRQRLASVLKIPVEGMQATVIPTPQPAEASRKSAFARPRRTAPGAPGPVPTNERLGHTRSALPPLPSEERESEPSVGATKPARRRRWLGKEAGGDPAAQQTRTVVSGTTAAAAPESEHRDIVVSSSLGARLSRLGARTISTLVGLLILAGLFTFAISFFLLSSATVTLVPEVQPLSTEMTYAIVAPDTHVPEDVAVSIPAEPMTLEFTTEASRPASGSRQVPGEPARGRVRLSNPNTDEVLVEAGTELESNNGRIYTVDQDVTVPAGDPGLGRYGGGEAAVTAEEGGTAGNLETGELSGQLDSGVYYSNRTAPLTGGTDEEIQVADPTDIQQLRDEAEDALLEMIENEVAGRVLEGVEIVPGSITDEDFRYEFSHQAGDDAKTVSVKATAPVTLLTFRPDEAQRLLSEEFNEQLTNMAPEGFAFDSDSLVIGDATPVENEQNIALFRVTGSGDATAVIPEDMLARLREELAGDSAESAADTLSELSNVSDYAVDYSPAWLPNRMPPSEDRISIEVEE